MVYIGAKYQEIGVCGLSCRLCPSYVMKTKSKCPGCKTDYRLGGPCPILHCAGKRNVEFCGDCKENLHCEKWEKHRAAGKEYDSFKCYQKLEEDIDFIEKNGLDAFRESQKIREKILLEMLDQFNEGRSKSYYCISATVLSLDELDKAVKDAKNQSFGLDIKKRAKLMRSILDAIAIKNNYNLKLRKKTKKS